MAYMQDGLKFKYEMDDVVKLFLDDIVPIICETEAFQRLRGISFLGAVEKTPMYCKRRHNRFDHSIGVALLAQHYAVQMDFSETERIRVVIAALLHDIGHAPLSHSLEPLFTEKFGLNHHIATTNILQGNVALGKSLSQTLLKNSIDADWLIDLMAGNDKSKFGRIFSAPINVDTMEAIWRGGSYFRKQFVHPIAVLNAFIQESFTCESVVDRFWQEKNTFYWLMIYSKDGVAADHWARASVWESKTTLIAEDFYLTEKHFLAKYGVNAFECNDPTMVDIKVRTFEIDTKEEISCYDGLSKRYKVIKSNRSVLLDPPVKKAENYVQPSIFDKQIII